MPPATPNKGVASLYGSALRAKCSAAYYVTPPAAEVDYGLSAGCGQGSLRTQTDCRGGYQPPANPPASFGGTPLCKGGFKRCRSIPQYRAAYEVAAAPRWDDCQAKAVIGAGAQMKSSHFVSTGGFIRGT